MAERLNVYGNEIPISFHHQGKYEYWRAVIHCGAPKPLTIQGKTKEELQKKLEKRLPFRQPGAVPEAFRIPLMDWVWKWFDLRKDSFSSTSQISHYHRIRQMGSLYGKYTLGSITHEEAQKCIYALVKEGYGNKHLEAVNNIAKQAMNWAVQCGYMRFNPFEDVKLPMFSREERLPLSRDEFPDFLRAMVRSPRKNAIAVMLYGGLRNGECRGLLWKDVNFQAGTITVRRQRQHCLDEDYHTHEKLIEKTKNGRCQTIHPPAELFAFLKDEKERQKYFQRINPKWSNPEGYVFTDNNGRPIGMQNLTEAVHRVGLAVNRPDLTPHYLRHTAGTMMFELTGDIRLTQDYLRHSDVRTTMLYVHSSLENKQEAMRRYDAFIKDRTKVEKMELFNG